MPSDLDRTADANGTAAPLPPHSNGATEAAQPAPSDALARDNGPPRLMRPPELAAALAVSHKTRDRMRAAGKVGPRVIRLSAQALRYDPAEVAAWLQHRDRNGQLYDAQAWPAVWQQLQQCYR
jgi:predicted DNA-binding transcriptional regulator AlpA